MEQIKLDLIPGYVPPICHASQYDEGRVIRVNLTEGGNAYTLSTETIELDVRKGDGNIVTSQLTVENGKSYVDIVTTEQMCAVAGSNLCELHVVKGSVEIGSLNFILECEPSPTEGGVRSNTVIDNLQTQINAMVAQALAGYGDIIPTEEVEKTPIANFTTSLALPLVALKTAITAQGGGGTPSAPVAIVGFSEVNVTRAGKNLADVEDATSITTQTILGTIELPAGSYTMSADCKNNSSITCYLSLRQGSTTKALITINANENTRKSIAFTLTEKATYSFVCSGANAGYNFDVSDIQLEVGSTATAYAQYNADTFTLNLGQTVFGGYVDWELGKLVVTDFKTNLIGNVASAVKEANLWRITANNPFYDANFRYQMGLCNALTFKTEYNQVNDNNNTVAFNNNAGLQLILRNDSITTEAEAITFAETLEFVYPLATPIEISLPTTMPQTIEGVQNWFADSGDIELKYKISLDEALIASKIKFTPTGSIQSTNVQDAIEEVSQ